MILKLLLKIAVYECMELTRGARVVLNKLLVLGAFYSTLQVKYYSLARSLFAVLGE